MKILAFDIEATDLAASWGRVLCCTFGEIGKPDVYTFRGDRKPLRAAKHHTYYGNKDVVDDKALVCAARDELEAADILVSWNGILYDIPMLNARLAWHGERPIQLGTWPKAAHLDLMYYSKGSSMRVGGSRLETVAKFLNLPNQKTPLVGATWQRAAVGDRKALDEVVEHCEADVNVLRDTFPHLAVHVKKLVLPLSKWWKFADQISL